MRGFLRLLVLAPILIVLLVFAVVNRQSIAITFDPFGDQRSGLTLHAPLFLALFGAMAVGVVVGGVATWLSQGRHRRAERSARSELARLSRSPAATPALQPDRSAL